ncbi:MAG: NAD(P)-dependent oxidoreductase, partial [Myxococcales bacterium]|nr:NAD(P)-dependent oxidoreductase [Myxococcales bacterium]
IASGNGVAIRKVVTEIGELMERPDLLQFGATPLRSDEPMKWVASVDRLRDEVGWQPSLSLRQGLEETIAWYRSELTSSSTYTPQTVPA